MNTLQEALAILLGAESEGKRVVEESKNEGESYLRSVQDKFTARRAHEMESAREQTKSILDTALAAAQTEAGQIAALGKEERARVQRRYEKNSGAIVASMVSEIAVGLTEKGREKNW